MRLQRRTLLGAIGAILPGFGARAEEARVTIDNFVFTPATITIAAGTRLVWLNQDDIPHTIVSSATPPLFRSHALDDGEMFAFVFDRPGRYPYFCGLHPHMRGVVVVT